MQTASGTIVTDKAGRHLFLGDPCTVVVGGHATECPGEIIGMTSKNVKVRFTWGNGRETERRFAITEGQAYGVYSKDTPARSTHLAKAPAGTYSATNQDPEIRGALAHEGPSNRAKNVHPAEYQRGREDARRVQAPGRIARELVRLAERSNGEFWSNAYSTRGRAYLAGEADKLAELALEMDPGQAVSFRIGGHTFPEPIARTDEAARS